MTRPSLRALLPVLSTIPLLAVTVGGWATITVEDLPDYITARQPVNLTFTVRQHGVKPLSGLLARVEAEGGSLRAVAPAASDRQEGRYTATLTLPQPGEWTITIHSGFGKGSVRLLPIRAVERGVAPVVSDGERGRRLFVAKGCVTCHMHADAAFAGIESLPVGPALTGRRFAAKYLEAYLQNPAIRGARAPDRPAMPNLGLKPPEIAALTVFLNAERRALQ